MAGSFRIGKTGDINRGNRVNMVDEAPWRLFFMIRALLPLLPQFCRVFPLSGEPHRSTLLIVMSADPLHQDPGIHADMR